MMKYITDEMLAEAINAMESKFDTHDIEQLILRKHTAAFARQILEHKDNEDVLQQFSASFSRCIGDVFHGQVIPEQKIRSKHLAGLECDNQQWRRLDAAVRTT